MFRLRSQLDLSAVVDELSALYDKKTLLSIYNKATEEPFSFLYVLLTAKKKEDMFFERFEHRLVPK